MMPIKFGIAAFALAGVLLVVPPSDGGGKYSDTAPDDAPPTGTTITTHPVYVHTDAQGQLWHILPVSLDTDQPSNNMWLWDDAYSHGAEAPGQFQPDPGNCPTGQGYYTDTLVFWHRSADLTVYAPERANAVILHSVSWTSSECYPAGYLLFVSMPGE